MDGIRDPQSSDAKGLARAWENTRTFYTDLDQQAFLPADPTDGDLGGWLVENLRTTHASRDRFARVAELSGEAVGFVEATVVAPTDTADRQLLRDAGSVRVTIDALVVQRSHWRKGIGRNLVEAVETWATARGAALVKLTTYACRSGFGPVLQSARLRRASNRLSDIPRRNRRRP